MFTFHMYMQFIKFRTQSILYVYVTTPFDRVVRKRLLQVDDMDTLYQMLCLQNVASFVCIASVFTSLP